MSDDACYADDIGDYRWEGFPLAQKFGWMQTGQGAGTVQPAVDALRGLSARYTESHRAVHAQLARLGVSWRGASADAAAAATTRLADWVFGAGQTVTGGGGSMESYGASFTALKPNIPPPPDVGAQSSAGHALDAATGGYGALVGLQSDHSRRLAAAAALDAQANAALTEHQQATRAALQSFPPAAEPPVLAAGTGPAGGGVPGGGSGVSAPGTGAAPGSGASPGAGAPAPSEGSTGPGGAGAGGTGPGGTGPGAGAGTEGAAAPTVNAGWTPLTPPAGQPGGASSGPLPGSHGGPIAAPPPYRPSATPGAHGGRIGGSAAAGGYGGGRPGGFGPAPPARGGPPPGSPSGPSGGADPGASRAAAGRGPGMGGLAGMPPLGMGGGVGGQERSHRNQTFIPSDEPFQVEHFDISPPVLGVRREEDDW